MLTTKLATRMMFIGFAGLAFAGYRRAREQRAA
jgi:hypothetical protein